MMGKKEKDHFGKEDQKLVVKAIEEAELNTSGEIRVHIESKCKEDILDHAAFIFEKLEMHKTDERNGILFYIALKDHKFAVIGDAGIHAKVGDPFWQDIRDEMIPLFKEGNLSGGLIKGIDKAGKQLQTHFPYQSNDKNELSNEISFN